MNRRTWLLVLLGLAVVGGLATWWLRTHERVERWIDLPPTGEVVYNPLYVLKLALRNDGLDVQSRQRLALDEVELGRHDTVLLFSDPRLLDAREAGALLDWVAAGGHLLLRTPPPGGFDPDAAAPLLDALGVSLHGVSPDCADLQVTGEAPHVEFCAGRRFNLGHLDPRHQWGTSEDGIAYARFAHGKGTVDLLADMDFLGNGKLQDPPHIVLARQLLAPAYRDDGVVHLIYAGRMPSLWLWLLRHGWMVWLPLALVLLAWLWRRSERFGPGLPAPPRERRSLLEHIVASGEHSWRYGYGHLLHAAVRDAFLGRLRRRDPVAAALTGEPQAALIAERLRRPADEIRNALATPPARDASAFRSRIATLIKLRNRL